MFLQKPIMTSTQIYLDNIYKLKNAFLQADAIIIGAVIFILIVIKSH